MQEDSSAKESVEGNRIVQGRRKNLRAGKAGEGMKKEASQTRYFCVAKNATLRAARPDPSASKQRSPQDDNPNLGGVRLTGWRDSDYNGGGF